MTVKRPEGGGELITQQHDIEMVSYLFSRTSLFFFFSSL